MKKTTTPIYESINQIKINNNKKTPYISEEYDYTTKDNKIKQKIISSLSPNELFIYIHQADMGWHFDDKYNILDELDDFYTENYDAMEEAVCKKVTSVINAISKEEHINPQVVENILVSIDVERELSDEGLDGFTKLYDLIECKHNSNNKKQLRENKNADENPLTVIKSIYDFLLSKVNYMELYVYNSTSYMGWFEDISDVFEILGDDYYQDNFDEMVEKVLGKVRASIKETATKFSLLESTVEDLIGLIDTDTICVYPPEGTFEDGFAKLYDILK